MLEFLETVVGEEFYSSFSFPRFLRYSLLHKSRNYEYLGDNFQNHDSRDSFLKLIH